MPFFNPSLEHGLLKFNHLTLILTTENGCKCCLIAASVLVGNVGHHAILVAIFCQQFIGIALETQLSDRAWIVLHGCIDWIEELNDIVTIWLNKTRSCRPLEGEAAGNHALFN